MLASTSARPSRARLLAAWSAIILYIVTGLAHGVEFRPDFAPGYRPDPSSDEGGFWYKVDQIEKQVQQSPQLVRNENLQHYLSGILCRLTPEYCGDIRIYVIRNPHFNAMMYPNGMMHIWTGTLLRADSEAQLAAVMAHEIAHYLQSHQIAQWRSLRNGLATAMVFDYLLTMGFASLAVAGSNLSFSRSQETDADLYGLQLMARAGYDPRKASELWDYTISERENDPSKSPQGFWSTHPVPEKRASYLAAALDQLEANPQAQVGTETHLQQVYPLYFSFMEHHIAMQDFGRSEVLLERHRSLGYPAALVNHFYGEMYRLRGQPGDQERAIAAYELAVSDSDAVPDSFRELGYLLVKSRDSRAIDYLQAYKQRRADASDLQMVDFYIQSLSQ
jgi:hypothetical protein